jgi:hypothetical protein
MAWAITALGLAGAAEAASPPGPTRLRAQEDPPGVVTLTWRDNSADEAKFQLQRRPRPGTFATILPQLPADATEFVDAIPPGAVRAYRVRARNADGNSPWSNVCWVNADPPRPTGLTVAARTAAGIRLRWQDNSTTETGFRIQRKAAGAARFETIATVPANTTAYRDETADDGTTYVYRVAALGDSAVCIATSRWSSTVRSEPQASACAGPLPDLRIDDCAHRAYRYTAPGEQADLVTDGSQLTVTGTVFAPVLGADTVELFAPVESATAFTFDLVCVPELDTCLVLPIEEDEVCFPNGDCQDNPLGIRIDIRGQLQDAGQRLHLEIVGHQSGDFDYAGSIPAP